VVSSVKNGCSKVVYEPLNEPLVSGMIKKWERLIVPWGSMQLLSNYYGIRAEAGANFFDRTPCWFMLEANGYWADGLYGCIRIWGNKLNVTSTQSGTKLTVAWSCLQSGESLKGSIFLFSASCMTWPRFSLLVLRRSGF